MINKLVSNLNSGKGSMNKHIIGDCTAYNYFSPKQIRESLLEYNDSLKFDLNANILYQANNYLKENHKQSDIVREVFYKYGLRLAEILYILENPTKAQKEHRKLFTEADWVYLKNIKRIYLAGGLLTHEFTKIFKKAISDFATTKVSYKEIVFLENSSNLALKGLTKKSKTDSLVYDFGQTNVKRGKFFHKKLEILDSIPVILDENNDLEKYALSTHEFIKNILIKDLKNNPEINEIHMAISNYVEEGVINSAPWHYGILHYYEPNYEKLLIELLSKELKRNIEITLHHDTTSMAYSIDDKTDAILISLGTAFGVRYFE